VCPAKGVGGPRGKKLGGPCKGGGELKGNERVKKKKKVPNQGKKSHGVAEAEGKLVRGQ